MAEKLAVYGPGDQLQRDRPRNTILYESLVILI